VAETEKINKACSTVKLEEPGVENLRKPRLRVFYHMSHEGYNGSWVDNFGHRSWDY
jgi:hypothetical protein